MVSVTKTAWLRPAGMIGGIYIFPVILLATGVIPFEWRFHVLVAMTLLAAGIAALSRRHSAISLGLTAPRFWALMRWSILPSAVMIGAIVLADLPHRHLASGRIGFYLFFVFVSAPAQEFLYRSFLFAELREVRIPPAAIVAVSTVLFSFMHIIYKDPVTMLLTLVAGLIWAVVFHKTQKVCLVAVSHAALGVVAILTGVI